MSTKYLIIIYRFDNVWHTFMLITAEFKCSFAHHELYNVVITENTELTLADYISPK